MGQPCAGAGANVSVDRATTLTHSPVQLRSVTRMRALRSLMYGGNVAISVFLMLVMMTYNAWLIGAIIAGAVCGSFIFDSTSVSAEGLLPSKGSVCH